MRVQTLDPIEGGYCERAVTSVYGQGLAVQQCEMNNELLVHVSLTDDTHCSTPMLFGIFFGPQLITRPLSRLPLAKEGSTHYFLQPFFSFKFVFAPPNTLQA